mmetsp:Transcript_36598/g.45176  ORF Transcript_36598/g.45176 Transcript_36598/m.45176 type:complete len:306 (-) Transcript_36598:230-1147(-)
MMTPSQEKCMDIMLQIMCIICVIYTIYIILVTFYKGCDKLSKKLKWLTILHVLCYTLRWITFFIHITIKNTIFKDIFNIISRALWVIAVVLFYSILVIRLQTTFKDSIYALKKYQIYLYIILISIIAPLWAVACYIKTYKYIFIFMCSFINLFIGLSVATIFTKNILNVIINMTQKDLKPKKLDNKQRILTKTITKNAILTIFALISYQILLIFWGILAICIQYRSAIIQHRFGVMLTSNTLIFIAIGMEIHCLFLSFAYNNNQYERLCSLCHNCIERHFTNHTERQMKIIIESETTQQQSIYVE